MLTNPRIFVTISFINIFGILTSKCKISNQVQKSRDSKSSCLCGYGKMVLIGHIIKKRKTDGRKSIYKTGA